MGIRALAFASTLIMSLGVIANLPKFKERRQRSFAAAASDGSLRRLQLLHLAGANVNAQTASCAPLFLAAREGRLNAVRFLLDEGADVNARAPHGHTALTEATFYGHIPIIKELLVRGADVNALSASGTALDIALSRNDPAAIELLKHYAARTANESR